MEIVVNPNPGEAWRHETIEIFVSVMKRYINTLMTLRRFCECLENVLCLPGFFQDSTIHNKFWHTPEK